MTDIIQIQESEYDAILRHRSFTMGTYSDLFMLIILRNNSRLFYHFPTTLNVNAVRELRVES